MLDDGQWSHAWRRCRGFEAFGSDARFRDIAQRRLDVSGSRHAIFPFFVEALTLQNHQIRSRDSRPVLHPPSPVNQAQAPGISTRELQRAPLSGVSWFSFSTISSPTSVHTTPFSTLLHHPAVRESVVVPPSPSVTSTTSFGSTGDSRARSPTLSRVTAAPAGA